jgi:glucose dehydrogenase
MSWRRFLCLLPLLGSPGLFAQADWPYAGNDPGGMKYSALKQITPANVTKLVRAWTYDSGDTARGFRPWEVTPLVINNVMYFSTMGSKVVALNPETGKEIWKFDVKSVTENGRVSMRGVSYWGGDAQNGPRIVVGTSDGLLMQLDAKNGQLVTSYGKNGVVDLKVGITEKFGTQSYDIAAAPGIYKNLAILAPSTGEQGRYGIPGDPRAFDLHTGEEVWRFHSVPQPGDPNFGTWGLDGWQDRKGPGIWTSVMVDPLNGLVFIPFGNPTDQNYGGSRPGNNLYSSSLVALDANTGKLKWYFQAAHHDIFDWDLSAPPTLIEVTRDGKKIPAIAQLTKKGLLFILNRLTGEAIYGVEERPVFPTDAPGDTASPTQPYPLKPPPVARLSMTREEVNKTSPESEKTCKAQYDKVVQAGPDTPYLMVPSLVFPSSEGGGSWGNPAFDPTTGLIFGNTRSVGTVGQLQPMVSSGILPSYAKRKIPFEDKDGYPCSAPPWGELFAVNANTGDIVWRVPLGEYKQLTERGVPITGTPNAGAPIVTASGLVFIGATVDRKFRAFDAKTGKELWSAELETSAMSTPLTYQGRNGKQYVAIVAGGGGMGMAMFVKPPAPDPGKNLIVAYALP